jgi:predicted dehydrogenase
MKKLKIAAIGAEHRHIFGQLKGMLDLGCECVGWWNDGDNKITDDFTKKYPTIKREMDKNNLLSNPEIDLVLIADIPSKRADLAIECMEAGKDVMLDKPGCTSLEQLRRIEETVLKTKRIFSIDFSERFEVPSVQVAYDLIQKGEIGNVVQTIGMGPHRLNLPTRPEWCFYY